MKNLLKLFYCLLIGLLSVSPFLLTTEAFCQTQPTIQANISISLDNLQAEQPFIINLSAIGSLDVNSPVNYTLNITSPQGYSDTKSGSSASVTDTHSYRDFTFLPIDYTFLQEGNYTLTLNVSGTAGSGRNEVFIDNTKVITIRVDPKLIYDLQASDLVLYDSTGQLIPSNTVTKNTTGIKLGFVIKDASNLDIPQAIPYNIAINGQNYSGEAQANQETLFNLPDELFNQTGNLNIIVTADSSNAIPEIEEGNNTSAPLDVTIERGQLPPSLDLVISTSIDQLTMTTGAMNIIFKIEKSGRNSFSGTYRILDNEEQIANGQVQMNLLNNQRIINKNINSIDTGKTFSVGSHTIKVEILDNESQVVATDSKDATVQEPTPPQLTPVEYTGIIPQKGKPRPLGRAQPVSDVLRLENFEIRKKSNTQEIDQIRNHVIMGQPYIFKFKIKNLTDKELNFNPTILAAVSTNVGIPDLRQQISSIAPGATVEFEKEYTFDHDLWLGEQTLRASVQQCSQVALTNMGFALGSKDDAANNSQTRTVVVKQGAGIGKDSGMELRPIDSNINIPKSQADIIEVTNFKINGFQENYMSIESGKNTILYFEIKNKTANTLTTPFEAGIKIDGQLLPIAQARAFIQTMQPHQTLQFKCSYTFLQERAGMHTLTAFANTYPHETNSANNTQTKNINLLVTMEQFSSFPRNNVPKQIEQIPSLNKPVPHGLPASLPMAKSLPPNVKKTFTKSKAEL